MSNSTDITAVTTDGALRVDPIFLELEPWLSPETKAVFSNARAETSAEMFFFSRLIVGDDARRFQDFAQRLDRLFKMFDGSNAYAWTDGSFVRPKISSCICGPLSIPLAKASQDETTRRYLFSAYVFVEGLPVTSWSNTELSPGNYEERRVWINGLVGTFLPASEAGMLPVNPSIAVDPFAGVSSCR